MSPVQQQPSVTSSSSSDNPPSYSALIDIPVSPPCYKDAMQIDDIQSMIQLGRETDLIWKKHENYLHHNSTARQANT